MIVLVELSKTLPTSRSLFIMNPILNICMFTVIRWEITFSPSSSFRTSLTYRIGTPNQFWLDQLIIALIVSGLSSMMYFIGGGEGGGVVKRSSFCPLFKTGIVQVGGPRLVAG